MESFDWNAFYWGLLFLMLAIGFIPAFARTYNRDLHKKSGIRNKGKCPCCGHPEPQDVRKLMKKEGGYQCEKCNTWVIPASRKSYEESQPVATQLGKIREGNYNYHCEEGCGVSTAARCPKWRECYKGYPSHIITAIEKEAWQD